MQKIAYAEKRLSQHRSMLQAQLTSTPVKGKRHHEKHHEQRHQAIECWSKESEVEMSLEKKKDHKQKGISSSIPRLIQRTTLRFQSVKPLTVENLAILETKNKKKGSFKVELLKRFLLSESNFDVTKAHDDIANAYNDIARSQDTVKPHYDIMHSNETTHRTSNQPQLYEATSGVKYENSNCSEELLRKLTKTLPSHLLKETEKFESPSSSKKAKRYLKNVLGIHHMKHIMLKREKNAVSLDRNGDPRLLGLVNLLET